MENNTVTLLETVANAVAKYHNTARMNNGVVTVYNQKGRLAGTVAADGTIERKYDGRQVLMGAIVRSAITAALKVVA